jgi:hypothetical protein
MTNFPEYLFVENGNGALPGAPNTADPTPRFIRNVRDVGNLANSDSIFSIYFRAAIILGGLGVGVDANSPYTNDARINGFNTFSSAYLFQLLAQCGQTEAAAFYEKWSYTERCGQKPMPTWWTEYSPTGSLSIHRCTLTC